MKVLNKRIPLIYVVLILLIIGFILNSVIYWYGPYYSSSFNLSPEQRQLQELSQMTDDGLINQIENLKYRGKITLFALEEKFNQAHKNMIDYLICKVEYNNNEEDYNRVKEYIERLADNEENKVKVLNRLDNIYLSGGLSFTNTLAVGELTEICPDKLVNLCTEEANRFPEKEKEYNINRCKDVCNLIDQYSKDEDKLEAEIIDNQVWIDKELSYNQKQYKYRAAMAYRLGGLDSAMKVCDNVNSSEKENCEESVNFLDNLEVSIGKCNNIRKELEELIYGSLVGG